MKALALCLVLAGCASVDVAPTGTGGTSADAGGDASACAQCSFGQAYISDVCKPYDSLCIALLADAGALGADCAEDADCHNGWCQAACCDPVSHVCAVVGKCRALLAAGVHCSHAGGNHECASGHCNPEGDTCCSSVTVDTDSGLPTGKDCVN